jgi:capsule polysaccharide export protein KpsC/LpsZ
VKIIHPLENSFSIIHNATAVITINSKVGAEALMQGKPLFVLGQAFYRNHGISYDISSISELEKKLTDFLKNKSNLRPCNKKIQDFLNAVWEKSLPGELYVNTPENINKFASSLIKALELGHSLKK